MSNIINKADLVDLVADATAPRVSKATVEEVVDAVLSSIAVSLGDGKCIRLHNFGSFDRLATPARKARNPQTGAVIDVPAGHRIRFRPARALKDA